MRQMVFLAGMLGMTFQVWAQQDTTKPSGGDTVRVGGIIIINKEGGAGNGITVNDTAGFYKVRFHHRSFNQHGNWHFDWLVVDLGFNNVIDNTVYTSTATQTLSPGATSDRFTLRNGKSIDFDLYLFMADYNLIKHVVNLKYGFGIESYDFRYVNGIVYHENPLLIDDGTVPYRKDKLALNYLSLPVMLNFDFTPHRHDPFGLSLGMSFDYLYDSHQKLISDAYGKQKFHSSYNLEPWKLAYVGELSLGPIGLYGSYALKSVYKYGLDMTPYTVGIRLGVNN